MKIIFFLLLLSCTAVFAQKRSMIQPKDSAARYNEAKAAIDKGNAEWVEGWRNGDAAKVARIFAPNGVQLSGSGKIIRGPKEIMARQKAGMAGADPGVKVTVITTKIWLDGTTAYEAGKYKYEYTVKGVPGTDEGKYVTIWKRQNNGDWKLAMDMGVPE